MTISSERSMAAANSVDLRELPRLPRESDGPVFAEPWQAQAFALAVKLSAEGHFTWKEWAATLADELQAASDRGEPDDGSRYYEYWLAALERLVTAKGLADPTALLARKQDWAAAYQNTPHGQPVELLRRRVRPTLAGCSLGSAARSRRTGSFSMRVLRRRANTVSGRTGALPTQHQASHRSDSRRAPFWARCSACGTHWSRIISRRCPPS